MENLNQMFEDIIKPEKQWPSEDRIFERCKTCTHADVGTERPRIHCLIAAGIDCAHNLEKPFGMWQPKDV